ncbi:Deoxyribose-phosphate aldolase [Rhizoctonia solani]|uniref:Deoxyribose-phosphate aldolase n=1 Tax=Rhizoctonia solani TaxID=456999 RepID=A0A0K6G7F6_9AGAM|nr:Deoxyribose-phosphate aldolase [Rhizoctonia solani]
MIDVPLLHPTMTDAEILAGLEVAKACDAATACVKPYSVPVALEVLKGTDVLVCPVIGFPAGNSSISVKVFEATEVMKQGAQEVDMVINIGKALGGEWDYVTEEIKQINDAVVAGGAILKVDPLPLFLTSTGYGFNKQSEGMYIYAGATDHNLKLMRKYSSEKVQVKAADGVRTLDDLLRVRALVVTRAGATTTKEILEEAVRRGIGKEAREVEVFIP